MAPRRRYTAKQRAQAAGIAVVEGVTEAERQTGIPKETIQYWTSKPEFAQLRTTARDVVADQFWVGIQIGLREVIKGIESADVPLKDKHQALATIYDRHALLTGGATGRMESRELNDLPDSTYVEAINEAKRLVEPARPDGAAEKEPAG